MQDEELKKKLLEYQILKAKLEALVKQREIIAQRMAEAEATLKAVNEIKASDEIVFSLGFNTFSRAKLLGDKMFIEIGAGIALEKPKEEALDMLANRKTELEKAFLDVEKEIQIISSQIASLEQELSKG